MDEYTRLSENRISQWHPGERSQPRCNSQPQLGEHHRLAHGLNRSDVRTDGWGFGRQVQQWGATRERTTWEFSPSKHERHPLGRHSGNRHGPAILRQCAGIGHHDHPVRLPATMRGGHPCSREVGERRTREAWLGTGGNWLGKERRPARRGRDAIRPRQRGSGGPPPAEPIVQLDDIIGGTCSPLFSIEPDHWCMGKGSRENDGWPCWKAWYRSQSP
jgi:hypothetical protein